MRTLFALMAQYDGQAVIPVDVLARDYFQHLTPEKLVAKLQKGEINLPLVRLDPNSQKTPKGVHITDLAEYIDKRREAAVRDLERLV